MLESVVITARKEAISWQTGLRKICPNAGRYGTSLAAQWLRLRAPSAGGLGSIPGQGTRSHVLQLRFGTAIYICVCVYIYIYIYIFKCRQISSIPGQTKGHISFWNIDFWFQIILQALFPNLGFGNYGPSQLREPEEGAVRLWAGQGGGGTKLLVTWKGHTSLALTSRKRFFFSLTSRKLVKPLYSLSPNSIHFTNTLCAF